MSQSTLRLSAALGDRYRIVRDLGEGGMARVYLTEDLRHDRRVALKVLKPELAAVLGAERFIQEIKTTANLHHPHILPLYDSGEAGGFLYYVMPYIDGETLRGRLDRETQLGVEEAVRIAREVADALDYAHRQGVVHRDIKPENILLHDGRPMVADFGIALAVSAAAGGRMTETGLSLGTPHYMSPEQATAEKELSGRSDVYSLGSVLYEMLTGDPPHTGSSAQQVIMKILTDPARPVTEVRRSVPANVAAAVARSLEKLPADRFAGAREFAEALANPSFRHGAHLVGAGPAVATGDRSWKIAAIVLAVVAAVLLARDLATDPAAGDGPNGPPTPMRSASILLPESTPLALLGAGPLGVGFKAFDLSPDGGRMVFVGAGADGERLHLRNMTTGAITTLPGTDGAYAPFFSPDGQWIGYFAGGSLARVAVEGGAPLPITGVRLPYGGVWLPDGRILVSEDEGSVLVAVPAAGGRPDTLRASPTTSLVFPEAIPGEEAVLLSSSENVIARIDVGTGATRFLTHRGWVDEAAVDSGAVDPGDLIRGTHPRALEGGRLLFTSPVGALMLVALPEDAGPEDPGEPVPVLEGMRMETVWGAGQWDVGGDGTLVYVRGDNALLTWLVRRDPEGSVDTLTAFGRANWGRMDLSPTGRRLLVRACSVAGECGLQIINLDEGVARALEIGDGFEEWRGWYDEDRLFGWADGERSGLVMQADNPTALDTVPGYRILDVADDGLVLAEGDDSALVIGPRPTFPAEVRRVDLDARAGWGWVLRSGGDWIAYTPIVQEDGEWQVYLARAAPPWERFRVSPGGGEEPIWLPDGALAYREGNRWMALDPPSSAGPPGAPRRLFEGSYVNVLGRSHDVDPAGRHLLVEAPGDVLADRMTIVTGWTRGLPELRGR